MSEEKEEKRDERAEQIKADLDKKREPLTIMDIQARAQDVRLLQAVAKSAPADEDMHVRKNQAAERLLALLQRMSEDLMEQTKPKKRRKKGDKTPKK